MNRAEFSRSLRQADTYRYREFVAQYLLKTGYSSPDVDPFAVDLFRNHQRIPTVESSDQVISQTYVSRESVERDVLGGGSLAVLGNSGSGLSMLGQWLARSVRDIAGYGRALDVFVPIRTRSQATDGLISALHPRWLAPAVFRAFRARVVVNDSALGEVEDALKGAPDWLQRLKWLSGKWARPGERRSLQAQSLLQGVGEVSYHERELTPEEDLLAAVSLVLDAGNLAPKSLPRSMRIIVDASHVMAGPELDVVLNDFEALLDLSEDPEYASCLTRAHALLLLNVKARERLEALRVVREDRLSVRDLEPWTPEALEMLLRKRLELFRPGEYLAEYWPRDLPADCIKADGRDALLKLITQGGTRIYEFEKQSIDAPIHVLRLARCLLAALAGQWEAAYPPPLSARSLEDLVNRYWEA